MTTPLVDRLLTERPKQIVLRAASLGEFHEEGVADEAGIYPGMLVALSNEVTDDWRENEVVKHASAGEDVIVRVAKEDALQGRTIDDVYVAGERVFWHECRTGDMFLARVAEGSNISKGDKLGSAGNGLFAVSGTKRLAEAIETRDMSDTGDFPGTQLIRVVAL